MAFTDEQYRGLLSRITKCERAINDIITALNHMVTNEQVSSISTVLQQEIDNLKTLVESYEARVSTLEQEPYDEVDV